MTNFTNYLIVNLTSVMPLSNNMKSVYDCVPSILKSRYVFQVTSVVICFIAVYMVDLVTIRAVSDKGKCDQMMNVSLNWVSRLAV
jgi:hypothetical protein